MCGARMRLPVFALVFMTVLSSCLAAKASKVDHNKDKWSRRGLVDTEGNAEYVYPESGDKARYERSQPKPNVGTIGHVDEGHPRPRLVENKKNEKLFRPTHSPINGVDHNDDKGHWRGLADSNDGNAKDGYPSNNVNNHHTKPRQDFNQGGDAGGGSG